MTFVADMNVFVCTFEDDSCPMHDTASSDEYWAKVDGSSWNDNTLNRGK